MEQRDGSVRLNERDLSAYWEQRPSLGKERKGE
jgi:hypothetical protein